jgi:hypothetical protein
MIIRVDEQGRETVKELCDIALKQGGIKLLQGITLILNSIEMIEPKKEEES